jgi:hypothetical protein
MFAMQFSGTLKSIEIFLYMSATQNQGHFFVPCDFYQPLAK